MQYWGTLQMKLCIKKLLFKISPKEICNKETS